MNRHEIIHYITKKIWWLSSLDHVFSHALTIVRVGIQTIFVFSRGLTVHIAIVFRWGRSAPAWPSSRRAVRLVSLVVWVCICQGGAAGQIIEVPNGACRANLDGMSLSLSPAGSSAFTQDPEAQSVVSSTPSEGPMLALSSSEEVDIFSIKAVEFEKLPSLSPAYNELVEVRIVP